MMIEQTVDDILINGKSIIKKDRYTETRKRVTRFKNQTSISDKEIIEYLAEEIEQYRNKIQYQEEYIKGLRNRTSQSEVAILECHQSSCPEIKIMLHPSG